MNREWAIGIDVGGTKIEGSLIHRSGEVETTLRLSSPSQNKDLLDAIVDMVYQLKSKHPIAGVGFSIPGSLNPKTGLLRNAPNSPAINGTPLAHNLKERLPYLLAFENDANCLAMSEFQFGAWNKLNITGIILGTGVGVGVVHNGELFHTPRGLAPEPGHLPLNVHGRPCLCGNKGCVEAYLSGPSILKRYQEAGGTAGDVQAIFENRDGDELAQQILKDTEILFARFLAMLVSVYDPEMFVLGGGLSKQPMFYQQEELIARFTFGSDNAPPVKAAQAGDASGKLGAASLIFNEIETG